MRYCNYVIYMEPKSSKLNELIRKNYIRLNRLINLDKLDNDPIRYFKSDKFKNKSYYPKKQIFRNLRFYSTKSKVLNSKK